MNSALPVDAAGVARVCRRRAGLTAGFTQRRSPRR
jgi:hypothetical protein